MSKRVLAAAIAVEVVVFAIVAPNFLSVANAFEVMRVSVEVGLLAVAMTPIVVTGGIDLSVGAMMGLAAVMFGAAFLCRITLKSHACSLSSASCGRGKIS